MRGFLLGAIVLVSLDVVLRTPGTRIAAALATPTEWLAKWTDARTPLIAPSASSSKTTSSKAASPASPSGNSLNAAGRAFAASIGDSDTVGKLINPADETQGTVATAKGIVDLFNSLGQSLGF